MVIELQTDTGQARKDTRYTTTGGWFPKKPVGAGDCSAVAGFVRNPCTLVTTPMRSASHETSYDSLGDRSSVLLHPVSSETSFR